MAARKAKPVLPLPLVIEEYARDLYRRDYSPKTIKNYRKVFDLAIPFWNVLLGHEPTVDDFTITQAEGFLDHLLARGKLHPTKRTPLGVPLSPESLRTYVRALKAFSSWLAAPKQLYTSENRLHLLPMPRKADTFKLPLTAEEMQAFVTACDPTTALGTRDLTMLLTFVDSGLRASELISLRAADVNVESGQIYIASGKGKRTRTIAVGDDTRRMLRRYAFFRKSAFGSTLAPDTPFFLTDRGKSFRYDGLRKWLIRLKTRAGVPRAFPHLLRHTSAVQTLDVPGADIVTLQAKLGHADIATTKRYLHMTSAQMMRRQQAFSPVDHLGLSGLMRTPAPADGNRDVWRNKERKDEK